MHIQLSYLVYRAEHPSAAGRRLADEQTSRLAKDMCDLTGRSRRWLRRVFPKGPLVRGLEGRAGKNVLMSQGLEKAQAPVRRQRPGCHGQGSAPGRHDCKQHEGKARWAALEQP